MATTKRAVSSRKSKSQHLVPKLKLIQRAKQRSTKSRQMIVKAKHLDDLELGLVFPTL